MRGERHSLHRPAPGPKGDVSTEERASSSAGVTGRLRCRGVLPAATIGTITAQRRQPPMGKPDAVIAAKSEDTNDVDGGELQLVCAGRATFAPA